MQSINAYLLALTLCVSGVATADHKDNHPPPTTGGTDLSDLACIEGQTVAFVGGVWVCADFPALTGLVRVQADFPANSGNLSTIATQEVTASCPGTKRAVGGGYMHFYGGPTGVIWESVPLGFGYEGWVVSGNASNSEPWRLSAVVMCADAEPEPPVP